MPVPLSAVVITLNAARSLDACLSSVRFADEIVVVDCGSTDGTQEIALRHGARMIHQDWLGYGPQKQFAVDQATHDWVLCVDADELVTAELRASIERMLGADGSGQTQESGGTSGGGVRVNDAGVPGGLLFVYEVCRCNKFMGRWLRHGEGYPDWIPRLFHRGHARWSSDPVHEKVTSDTPQGRLCGDLLHDSAETLGSYIEKQNRYSDLQASKLIRRGLVANAASMLLSPCVRFVRFYFLKAGFLDGFAGLVHVGIGSLFSGKKYLNALLQNETVRASDLHHEDDG